MFGFEDNFFKVLKSNSKGGMWVAIITPYLILFILFSLRRTPYLLLVPMGVA
jgi:fumarate reductase subunit D